MYFLFVLRLNHNLYFSIKQNMIPEKVSCIKQYYKGTYEQCDIKMQTRCDERLMQYYTGMQGILYMFSFLSK